MIVDQDIIQRIKVIGIFVLQFYKVLTGTLLTLFVPQACYSEITDGSEERNLQICSLMQNYENNEIYHRTTLNWNGFSFLLFVMCYMFELRREHWAIKFLDINNDIPDNALKEKIIEEPKLDKTMDYCITRRGHKGEDIDSDWVCIGTTYLLKKIDKCE